MENSNSVNDSNRSSRSSRSSSGNHIKDNDLSNKQTNNKLLRQLTMGRFTVSGHCEICGHSPSPSICNKCSSIPSFALFTLQTRLKLNEIKDIELTDICHACAGNKTLKSQLFSYGQLIGIDCCESLDCNIFHERCRLVTKLEDNLQAISMLENNLSIIEI